MENYYFSKQNQRLNTWMNTQQAAAVADLEIQKGGVQPLAREARPQIFGLPRPLPVKLPVQTEYLEATLGLVKCQ